MGFINTDGYFKGVIVSGEFGQSKNGLPQEIWMLKATEIYDEEGEEYLPVDSEADEITAYLTMFNHDDSENFNTSQIKKITGWDGADFNVLANMDLTGVELSWRVGYGKGDYADKLGVNKVDVPDASPTRAVTKLAKEDVVALQARYAPVLAATKAPVKAASAKTGKKTAKKTSKKSPAKPTPKAPPQAKPDAVVGKCTDQEAYTECFALSGSEGGDELEKALNIVWSEEVAKVNVDEAKISEEEWYTIKEQVSKRTSKV